MPTPQQFLTLGMCKTLIGLAPIAQSSPRVNAVIAKYRAAETAAKTRRKKCCEEPVISMNLVNELGTAIFESPPEAKQVVLRVMHTSELWGWALVDRALKKVRLAP